MDLDGSKSIWNMISPVCMNYMEKSHSLSMSEAKLERTQLKIKASTHSKILAKGEVLL